MGCLIRRTAACAVALTLYHLAVAATLPGAALHPQQDGGVPVAFPSNAVGASAVRWVELPGTAALSASVTGPFAIALQPSYSYGAIDGVTFASTASTTGVCSVPSGTTCSLYLGIELLASAPVGTATGTVTLSNGLTYTVTADVLGPALDVEPAALDLGSIPVGSVSDATAVTLTNVSNSAITVGAASVSGPFTTKNTCPASLAAHASCVVTVAFVPTATGAASGFAQVSTSQGSVGIALSGIGADNPADISLSPASLNLPLLASNDSGNRRITLTNLSPTSVSIGAPTGNICAGGSTQCLDFTANTCATLAAGDNCQFSVHYVGAANEVTGADTLAVPVTVGATTTQYSIVATHSVPPATAPTVLLLSTTDLRFPATPFGSASAAQTLTVKNLSSTTLGVIPNLIPDFVPDPVCSPLLPGASCNIAVHYVPTSGNTQASAVLNFVAYDYSSLPDSPTSLGSAGVTVSGTSISTAALASPSYPPLVSPLPAGGFEITNASSTPLVLAGIYGGGNSQWDASSCPRSLAAGAGCPIFATTGCGSATSLCSLTVASNALSSPDVYSILGDSGDGSDTLFVATGPLVFAPTAVGATSSAQAIFVNLIEDVEPSDEPFAVFTNDTGDFTIDNQCPAVLLPSPGPGFLSAHCSINVQFTPQSAGFKAGTITWTSRFDSGTILIAGTAQGAAGLTLSPTSLFLGAQSGQTASQTVTLTNLSGSPVSLGSFALAGAGAASFRIGATTCGASLAAGATCTVAVIYATPSTYLATATLVISSGAGTIQSVALSGVIPSVALQGVTEGSLPFAETTVGHTTHTKALFLSYDGYPLTVTSLALTGPNAASYSIVSNTCTGTLLQGVGSQIVNCQVELEFAPKAVGSLPETLEFTSSVGVTDFDLTSVGGPVPATVSPVTLDFGSQAVGTPSAPLTITLTNPNPIALGVHGAGTLGGANVGDFALAGVCSEIPANGSCTYSVSFTPAALGSRSASLPIYAGDVTFYQSGMAPTATVVLVGGGIANATPGVNLSAAYNVVGIGVDGATVPAGGLDGLGDSYSGTLLGSSLYWSGSYFTFGGAGAVDAISGGTIALPAGKYAGLKLLATAVRSNQPNQRLLVTYTDGSSTSLQQSFSSWTTPQNYPGESVATTLGYRLNPNGTHHPGTYNLYGYSFALDDTKTVKSLTLPNDREVVVLGIDLKVTDQVPVDLSKTANVSAVHTDGVAVDGAGIDDLGNAYSAQLLGTSLTWAGVTFNLPEALPVDALANTTLALPAGSFSKLSVLATGVQGNQRNHSFVVTYADGTTATFKQSFSDWHTPQGYPGETDVLSMAYRLNGAGAKQTGTYVVYGYSLPLDPAKTVKSVALPGVRTVVVLAVTLSP